jgi:hypothetical protein
VKIIDHTPFFNENGELSLVDRGRAVMKFGSGWLKEIEAQKIVINTLEKSLDKKYTLLRNVTPSGLGTAIPLILIGPTGVYVMTVTPLTGTISARGDQWGTISGDVFHAENPNLLTRTQQMAKVVQVFLQRQGYADLLTVEPILLCSDPATHVDTVRPIIRVIMRDSLERFAVSISQARVILSPESVFDIGNRILNPPASPPGQPSVSPEAEIVNQPEPEKLEEAIPKTISDIQPEPIPLSTQDSEMNAPDAPAVDEPYTPINATSVFEPDRVNIPDVADPGTGTPSQEELSSDNPYYPYDQVLETESQEETPARKGLGMNRKQWIFLGAMFVIWIIIVVIFAFLVVRDFNPQLFLPK